MSIKGIGRHERFLTASATGLAVLGAAWLAGLAPSRSPLLTADAMFLTFIALTVPLLRLTPDHLSAPRRHGRCRSCADPYGRSAGVGGHSVGGLHGAEPRTARYERADLWLRRVAAGLSHAHHAGGLPLAHLFDGREDENDRGGLVFPGDAAPDPWDFL